MKIIHKTQDGIILSEVQYQGKDNDRDQVEELKKRFDDKTIIRLEIEFQDGIKCTQVHDFGRVKPEMLKSLTAVIEND